jgi:hypothetical protein
VNSTDDTSGCQKEGGGVEGERVDGRHEADDCVPIVPLLSH